MAFADRNLVDADDTGAWRARSPQLLTHVLLLQLFDRLPIQVQFPRHIAQRGRATPSPHKEGKAVGIEGIVGQPGNLLLLHGSAPEAPDATYLDLQVHARIATRQVADLSHFVIVEGPGRRATHPTACFFPRRTRHKMRALGSPKTPRTVALGRNPAKRYVSISRRSVGIAQACHVFPHCNTPQTLIQSHFPTSQFDFFTHSIGRRSFVSFRENVRHSLCPDGFRFLLPLGRRSG